MKPGCKPIFIKTTAYTKVHSNEVSANPYTGVELPTTIGVHNGDTVSVQFSDGTIVDYTFNGTIWEVNFANNWAEERICLNNVDPLIVVADINNPTTAEIQAWATSNLTYEQRVNGTILTYYIDGDCDNPDFTWVLNKGSELITLADKRVRTSNILYIDNIIGSDTLGFRNYFDKPFKTFSTALTEYQDGDWIKYWNTNESISGTNINPLSTTHFYDFGCGNITINAGGNAFIGEHNLTGSSIHNANIRSIGQLNLNKCLFLNKTGELTININKLFTSSFVFSTKDNVNINIDNVESTSLYPLGFWSGTNKSCNISLGNVTINNASTSGYTAGIFQFETNQTNTDNSVVNFSIDNATLNTNMGLLTSITSTGGLSMNNCLFTFNVGTVNQISTLYNPITMTTYQYCLLMFQRNAVGTFNDSNFTYNFDNINSDLTLLLLSGTATYNNVIHKINGKGYINKGRLFHVNNVNTLNNSKFIISGEYNIVNSAVKGIDISNLNLSNNSTLYIDIQYVANNDIYLQNLTIDATSKIVFKGRYELGNGRFDISGVTGAGANNIYFEDCTIVTNATECIYSGTAKNVKIINARSNKPAHANVTETISPILVNSNIQ